MSGKKLKVLKISLALASFLVFSSDATVLAQSGDSSKAVQQSGRGEDSDHNEDRNNNSNSPRTVDARGIVVDDDGRCPGIDFTTIQAAVNASPAGSTIQVCPGTYREQVRVNKRLNIVGVQFQNEGAAIIKPNLATANSTSLLPAATPIAALVLVDNTTRVTLENLTVDGANTNLSSCTPNLVGIFFRNASGTINGATVRNIRSTTGTCQTTAGIFAQSGGNNGRTELAVYNTSVHDYEKVGILGNEPGTELTAIGNSVTGIGSTQNLAQNGIQIGFGADGKVEGNFVINNLFAGCTTVANCIAATNILVFQADNADVRANTVGKSNVNIFAQGDRNDISFNTVSDTDVGDGIGIVGDRNDVSSNRIFNSDEAGVFILGDQNRVQNNFINETQFGVLRSASSSNNDIRNNRFYNTVFQVVTDTAAQSAAQTNGAFAPPRVEAVRP